MSVAAIINPLSGAGADPRVVERRISFLRDRFRDTDVDGTIAVTERARHAYELAAAAASAGVDVIIAWGGDGTVNEIGSAIAGSSSALAVIPAGSGNGLAVAIGAPRNPAAAFDVAIRGRTRQIDAGEIDRDHVLVQLIGWCDLAEGRRVADIAADCGISECVNMRGPLARPEALKALIGSNLLLLLAEGLTAQIPGKTYEYLRAGRPILALTSEGALADLLRRTGGAWVVDQRDVAGIVAAVREIYRRWNDGRPLAGAPQASVSGFDRRVLAGRFAELFTRSARSLPAGAKSH